MSEDINVGAISEALNNKADRDMVNSIPPYLVSRTPNEQGGVVEIWSDGYCVQTGRSSNTSDGEKTIEFSVPFKDDNYYINCLPYGYSGNSGYVQYRFLAYGLTTTSFKISGWMDWRWEAKGYIR